MPIYAFACSGCGPFDVLRAVSQAGVPATCPRCGGEARRVFTPPRLARLERPVRRALELEEQSAHEPQVTRAKRGRPLPHRHEPTPPWVLTH